MNLFICRTIFQAYYASVIISRKKLSNILFIYLSENFSEREKIVLGLYKIDYILVNGKGSLSRILNQLKIIRFLRNEFKKNWEGVDLYLASIDDLFIQTIISKFCFRYIYSFDDGTANYIKESMFFIERKFNKAIIFKYYVLGNRIKHIDEVKQLIKLHYSSNSLPNIIEKVETIPLSDVKYISVEETEGTINIYLCPLFDELYMDAGKVRQKFISSLSFKDIVIPHPRDSFDWSKYKNYTLDNKTIAEKSINDWLSLGYMVNLFGIANSTQYHFLDVKRVNNFILDLGVLNPNWSNVIHKQIAYFKNLSKYK